MFFRLIFSTLIVAIIFCEIIFAKIHHRRHVHKRHKYSINQINLLTNIEDCEEPLDLKTRLMSGKLSSEEMYDDLDSRATLPSNSDTMEEFLSDEFLPTDSNKNICSQAPTTDIDSSVMQRSLCPWRWRINEDLKREPKAISEAICLCRRSRGSSGSYCMPIRRRISVLKREGCNPLTKKYEYTKSTLSITVGCHSVLPRTQRALPLSAFYSNSRPTLEV